MFHRSTTYRAICFILGLIFNLGITVWAQTPDEYAVDIVWSGNIQFSSGEVHVSNAKLKSLHWIEGKGTVKGQQFKRSNVSKARLRVRLTDYNINPGPNPSSVTIRFDSLAFTVLIRDVQSASPVFLPQFNVAVLPVGDNRNFERVAADVYAKKLLSKFDRIEQEPETNFDNLDEHTRDQYVPTWLGTSRDIRIFQINEKFNQPATTQVIYPKNGARAVDFEEAGSKYLNVRYGISYGRGESTAPNISRRLEDGILPILNSVLVDDDIHYHNVSFVVNELYPLDEMANHGTNYLVASNSLFNANFSEKDQETLKQETTRERNKPDQTILCWQLKAINTGQVPRYAWFRIPMAIGTRNIYDTETGLCSINEKYAFSITKLNGKPVPNEEISVLVHPGDTALFEVYLAHRPIEKERLLSFEARASFEQRFHETKAYWKHKLQNAAKVKLPEKRLQEMIYAGLLHMDLITYGKEADSVLAAAIGVYPPIGTESAPIIQFYLSMGWFDKAKMALQYFLEKQFEDGMIQNFGHYMVETGGALWNMGEYYRYTRDTHWVKANKAKILKSADYLINWRNQNKVDSLKLSGYGMIKGKVADPEDHFHQFMLNGYGYLGLSRVAEMLADIDQNLSQTLTAEAAAWKDDILRSVRSSFAKSPVVPLGDGTWTPTLPPWTEAVGPRALYLVPEKYRSHGTFLVPDAMLGPIHLIFCEVLDAHDPMAKMMLDYHSELFYLNNTVFSQPYYSRHNWVQLKRGMVKPYLKTFYNTVAAISDKETYTFWEHLYQVSVHKTHEEGWFLMELRWMLFWEEADTLHLLRMIPRHWFATGQSLRLDNVRTYFGPVSLTVTPSPEQNRIMVQVVAQEARKPKSVTVRVPLPEGRKVTNVVGGSYDVERETVRIDNFNGEANLTIYYTN